MQKDILMYTTYTKIQQYSVVYVYLNRPSLIHIIQQEKDMHIHAVVSRVLSATATKLHTADEGL